MTIGLDIDGCIADSTNYIRALCGAYLGRVACNEHLYDLAETFQVSRGAVSRFWEKKSVDYCKGVPLRKEVADIVTRLMSHGHKVIIITNRADEAQVRQVTQERLAAHGISYDEIEFTSDKSKVINTHKVDIMVEDSPSNIETIAKNTNTMIICYDAEYNRSIEVGERVKRAYDWEEVYELIRAVAA